MQDLHIDSLHETDLGDGVLSPLGFAARLAKDCPLLAYIDYYGGRRLLSGKTADRLYASFREGLATLRTKPAGELSAFVRERLRVLTSAELGADAELVRLEQDAVSHIAYHRITLRLPITDADLKRAEREWRSHFDEPMEGSLLSGIRCGVRLFAFGKSNQKSAEEIPLLPYVCERELPDGGYDFPPREAAAGIVRLQRARLLGSGEKREYLFELILPVHSLFGVCFKPYLYFEKGAYTPEYLSLLFGSAFKGENDCVCDRVENRLWFSLALPKNATEMRKAPSPCGCRRDVIFPQ